MKTAIISMILTLMVLAGVNTQVGFAQNKTNRQLKAWNSKNAVKRDARKRAKIKQSQGWIPIPEVGGDAKHQFLNLIEIEQLNEQRRNQGEAERYVLESQLAKSLNPTNARSKARDAARKQLAKNLGSVFSGRIETGEYFVNGSGEDLTDEIEEAVGAFDEIFESELSRNRMVTGFQKQEGGATLVDLTIVLDLEKFEAEVKKLKKAEIQMRIDRVRKKHESAKN